MTIDEAIETMSERFSDPLRKFDDDYFKAIQLGIAALKRVKGNRVYPPTVYSPLLPGETEVAHSSTG